MLKNLAKTVRRRVAFGVENATSAPGRFMDERKLKRLKRKETNAFNKMDKFPSTAKSELEEAGKGMQKISKNNKDRLTRLKAIDYYSK
jgi:hypothetical protein